MGRTHSKGPSPAKKVKKYAPKPPGALGGRLVHRLSLDGSLRSILRHCGNFESPGRECLALLLLVPVNLALQHDIHGLGRHFQARSPSS